jgi:hypothetical protein
VLVLRPDVAFVDANPLLLPVEGEYAVKNLVFLAATAALALHARSPTGCDHQPAAPRRPRPSPQHPNQHAA